MSVRTVPILISGYVFHIQGWDADTVTAALFSGSINHFVVASNAECIKHAQLVNYETLAVVMRHQTADCIK